MPLNLTIDLETGVRPVSNAASHLAQLIAWATQTGQPVVITQKGAPSAVLLSIETFTALRALLDGDVAPEPLDDITDALPFEAYAA